MKKIVSALLFCALLLSLAACSQKSPTAQETEPESSAARTVTDSFGREVTIPAEVKAIVCTGSGALRMVTYLQCTDRLVGVEDCDKEYADSTLRDYAYVYHDTFDALPSIGKGGGTANTAYVEELIRLQPDVILSGYTQEALEDLAQSTGIPCVSIRAKSINFIDDSFYTAMRVAAEVLGVQERCEEVLQYIDGCKADLDARTADIPDEGKPAVYAGAVTFSGAHGFTGTYSNFGPLITVERTSYFDRQGMKWNGNNCYTILPIQEAVDHSYERQMVKLEEVTERQRVAEELQKQGRVRPCEPLCAALPGAARTDTGQAYSNGFGSPFES